MQTIGVDAGRRPLIALATYAAVPEATPDDRLLLPAFGVAGIDVGAVPWSDGDVDWSRFDAIILRSCWDYHLRIREFLAWLDGLAAGGVLVLNSPALVRWNADKRYLLELASRGAATIPTRLVAVGGPDAVEKTLVAHGWAYAVIKPVISASGHETYAVRAPLNAADAERVARVVATGDVLVQPFANEVPRDGELSLTFIDGVYSHATIKRARDGEFRVQTEHGGSAEATAVSPAVVQAATRVLALLPEPPLFARVDGIVRQGEFLLMELELIEPNLFFAHGAGAAERFVGAVQRAMHRAMHRALSVTPRASR